MTPDVGGFSTVTITVTNAGTGTCPIEPGATNYVADNIPAGMVGVESSLQIGGGLPNELWTVACWEGGQLGGSCQDVRITFWWPYAMPSGYTVQFRFQVQITATSGSLQNCAYVTNYMDVQTTPIDSCATVIVVPSSVTTSSGVGVASGFTLPVVGPNGLTVQTVTLSSFQGKVVLLEFMEPWSPHCQNMAPVLNGLYAQYNGGNVVFLTVAGPWQGATANNVANFISQYGTGWTYVYDSSGSVFSNYGVNSTPAFYIIGTNGSIVRTLLGEQTIAALSGAISSAGGT